MRITPQSLSFGVAIVVALITFVDVVAQELPASLSERTWKDSSGVFSITGTLIEMSPTSVKIRDSDGQDRTLDRSRLSEVDQQYVIGIEQAKSPFQFVEVSEQAATDPVSKSGMIGLNESRSDKGTGPFSITKTVRWSPAADSVSQALGVSGSVRLYSFAQELKPFQCKPLTNHDVPAGRVELPLLGKFTQNAVIGGMVMLEPSTKSVVFGVQQILSKSDNSVRSYLVTGDLPNGPFRIALEADCRFSLIDHNLTTGYSLVLCKQMEAQADDELIVFEHVTDERIRVVWRYRLPALNEQRHERWVQGRLLDDNKVVLGSSQGMYCWDLSSGSGIYFAPVETPEVFRVAFSHDDSVWARISPYGIQFVNSATGESLGSLKLSSDFLSRYHVAFGPSGDRVAILGAKELLILNTTTGEIATWELNFKAEYDMRLSWRHPELIMQDGYVVDTRLGARVWQYGIESRPSTIWGETMSIINLYPTPAIYTLPFPHPPLLKVLKKHANRDQLVAVPSNSEVAFTMDIPDGLLSPKQLDALSALFQRRMEEAGWKVVPKSAVKFRLTVQDANQALVVGAAQAGIFFPPEALAEAAQSQQDVPETNDFVARLECLKNNSVLWADSRAYSQPVAKDDQGQRQSTHNQLSHEFYLNDLNVPTKITNPALTIRIPVSRLWEGNWREDSMSSVIQSLLNSGSVND